MQQHPPAPAPEVARQQSHVGRGEAQRADDEEEVDMVDHPGDAEEMIKIKRMPRVRMAKVS